MHLGTVVNPNIWACYLWQIKTNETKMTSIFRQINSLFMSKRMINVRHWTNYSEFLLLYWTCNASYTWFWLYFVTVL